MRRAPVLSVPAGVSNGEPGVVAGLREIIRGIGRDPQVRFDTLIRLDLPENAVRYITTANVLSEARTFSQAPRDNVLKVGALLDVYLEKEGEHLKPHELQQIGDIYTAALDHGIYETELSPLSQDAFARQVERVQNRGKYLAAKDALDKVLQSWRHEGQTPLKERVI